MEKTASAAVESFIHALRREFTGLVEKYFDHVLDNGTVLAMTMDTMERAVESNFYLQNMATELGQTDGVAAMVSETVRAQAGIEVTAQHEAQKTRLDAYCDDRLALPQAVS